MSVPGSWTGGGPPVSLLAVTGLLLFVPKLLALVLALASRRRQFGGAARLLTGALLETLFAVTLAPLMMMFHARFVVSVVTGHDVPWDAQVREGRMLGWREAARSVAWTTAVGAAWAALTLYYAPVFFLWLTPIFAGLLLAVPLVRWTSSRRLGAWSRRRGLFLVPSETEPPAELQPAPAPAAEPEAPGAPGLSAVPAPEADLTT